MLKTEATDGSYLFSFPKPLPKPEKKLKTITDICKERIRHVIEKFDADDASKLNLKGHQQSDFGFRAFKLSESNLKPWSPEASRDAVTLVQQLEIHVDHIRQGRTGDDFLFAIVQKAVATAAAKQMNSLAQIFRF